MEKSLFDILEEEHCLVRDINNLTTRIELTSGRIELLTTLVDEVDYEYEPHYITHLQDEINYMNAEKDRLQNELAECRRELKQYYKRYILD